MAASSSTDSSAPSSNSTEINPHNDSVCASKLNPALFHQYFASLKDITSKLASIKVDFHFTDIDELINSILPSSGRFLDGIINIPDKYKIVYTSDDLAPDLLHKSSFTLAGKGVKQSDTDKKIYRFYHTLLEILKEPSNFKPWSEPPISPSQLFDEKIMNRVNKIDLEYKVYTSTYRFRSKNTELHRTLETSICYESTTVIEKFLDRKFVRRDMSIFWQFIELFLFNIHRKLIPEHIHKFYYLHSALYCHSWRHGQIQENEDGTITITNDHYGDYSIRLGKKLYVKILVSIVNLICHWLYGSKIILLPREILIALGCQVKMVPLSIDQTPPAEDSVVS